MVASRFQYPDFSTRFLHLSNGYTVEYVDCGEGTPIVLLPGLAGGTSLLWPMIESLSKSHRVLSYQLRGEGISCFDRSFNLKRLAVDLREFIDSLKLERPGLVGFSFGAAIALEFATLYQNRIGFLAIQGAGSAFRPGLFGDVARRVLDRFALPTNSPFINQFFNLLLGSNRVAADQFDFVVEKCWQTDQSVMCHRLAMLDDYDVSPSVPNVVTPSLVFGCENDVLVRAAESQSLASELPNSRFFNLKEAGHFAFVTHSRMIARQVQSLATTTN